MARKKKDIFKLLDNPPEFKVDRNYERQNRQIQKSVARRNNEEEVRRQALFSDSANRFIADMEMYTIHDRSCLVGKSIQGKRFSMIQDFNPSMNLCETCRIKALIRQMTENPKQLKEIFKFLQGDETWFDDLQRLYEKGAVLRYITCNTLEIQVGIERWRLERQGPDRFLLLHNSYLIVNYQRYSFTKKFHAQPLQGRPTFHHVVNRILSYNSGYHVRQIRREDELEFKRGLELAPVNAILVPETAEETFRYPTSLRLKYRGFWYDYYTYIDCINDVSTSVFTRQNIRSQRLLELVCGTSGYLLVCCKVPKWQRRRFHAAMNDIKKGMYEQDYQRGFVALEVITKFLGVQGVRYEV